MRKSDFTISQVQASIRLRLSPSVYVRQCAHLPDLYEMLPDRHVWKYDSGESLACRMVDATDPRVLWAALLEDFAALTISLAWKTREATSASVMAINQRSLAAAAMTARGALEAATAAINHVVELSIAESKLAKPGNQEKTIADLLERLDQSSVRGLWGRKGGVFKGKVNANHFYNHQRSVLKYAEGNAQFGPEIVRNHAEVYETLCSMAHPSADGHQPYMLMPAGDVDPAIQQRISLSAVPDFRQPQATALLEAVLWALGWSAAHSVHAWEFTDSEHRKAAAQL